MAAAAAATMAPPQMILLGENHFPVGGKIKISDPRRLRRFTFVKFFDAVGADASTIALRFRHLRQQFRRHFYLGAPARAFVGGGRTKLARIRRATKRTPTWV